MADRPATGTIYLHIGTQKTGTTTLQNLGSRNRDALARLGVLYPRTPGDVNHHGLPIFAAWGRVQADLTRDLGLHSQAEIDTYLKLFPDRLHEEIAASGCSKVWLSNEHLSSRIRNPEYLARLAKLLRGLAQEVKVIVYLRHQPEFYLSTYSMKIKAGSNKDVAPPATGAEYYYNYDKMLGNWARAFGEEAIIVRVFEREALLTGDVVDDLFAQMGVAKGDEIVAPKILNPSLDAQALQFLRLFRNHIPRYVDETPNADYGDLTKALEALPMGRKFGLPAATMQRIAQMFAPSNAKVARRFLHRADGQLFAPVDYSDDETPAELTVEQAVEISAFLWRWKHRQLAEMKQQRRGVSPSRAAEPHDEMGTELVSSGVGRSGS